jgi:solute:Na+ symporter, SSS family
MIEGMPYLLAFETLDWGVLFGYFAVLVAATVLLSRRQSGTEDYFLGGRRMPAWAVALSVVATAISAATFVGAPYQSYIGDLTYLSATIGQLVAIVVVALFFIPVYYRENATTVYDIVGTRYGPGAKQACSWMFMIGRVFANGARLFMAGLAGSQLVWGDSQIGHVMLGIAALSIIGVAYTWFGGIKAVIWVEVVQTIILVGAAVVAIGLLLNRIPAPTSDVIDVLAKTKTDAGSKLDVIRTGIDVSRTDLGLDLSQPFTLVTALLCWTIFNLAAYGTDHDLAQRMLTCKSAVQGGKSAVGAILIGLPITALFMAIGLLLYIFYDRPDVMGASWPGARPGEPKDVFLTFIRTKMPQGVAGLMMAGMFAAALSSLSSALNAMASTFVNDVYKRVRPGADDRHYLFVGRASMAGWGVILGAFACLCVYWHQSNAAVGRQTLIDFALGVMNFAYAGLAAVFCTAIFTKRGNGSSAIAALATGFLVVLLMQPAVWKVWTQGMPQFGLTKTTIAGPWVLLIGFTLSFVVCCLGKRKAVHA